MKINHLSCRPNLDILFPLAPLHIFCLNALFIVAQLAEIPICSPIRKCLHYLFLEAKLHFTSKMCWHYWCFMNLENIDIDNRYLNIFSFLTSWKIKRWFSVTPGMMYLTWMNAMCIVIKIYAIMLCFKWKTKNLRLMYSIWTFHC